MAVSVDLNNKLITPNQIAEMAVDDQQLLEELLKGISPQTQKSARRENCSQAILCMAETWPEMLIPHWDYFCELFKCSNGSSKYVAVYVIASLSKADKDDRLAGSLDSFLALLDDESVMVASHTALNAGKIALEKPQYREVIIQQLLQVDQTHHDESHLSLLKAYVIDALDVVYESSTSQTKIMEFIKQQFDSTSPKTRKLAKAFVKKRDL